MATNTYYDAPLGDISTVVSLEQLRARCHAGIRTTPADIDDDDLSEGYGPPGAEPIDEELTITLIPLQRNEFRCGRCFLVCHQSQRHQPGRDVCHECA